MATKKEKAWNFGAWLMSQGRKYGASPAKKRPKAKRAKVAKRKTTKPKATAAKKTTKRSSGSEAISWLTKNKNPHGFAGNADALSLVRRLYDAGAKRVTVAGILREPWRIKEEGGPYADILNVELPSNAEKAARVEAVAAQSGADENTRHGSKIRLWWD